ncbi:MAG: hypothetical protein GY838_14620 [bacterium]|nr:hypothetical protein [bacterium]
MTAVRKTLMIMAILALLLALGACTREVEYVESSDPGPSSCMDCHGDDNPVGLIQASAQWANSHHASGANTDRNYSDCSGCHTSEGFIDRITTGELAPGYNNPTAIHCFTCHAPHTEGTLDLRVTEAQFLQDGTTADINAGNLCVSCHQARRDVNTYVTDAVTLNRYWGPHHGTQGDLLFAGNGYEYDGWAYDDTEGHRTVNSRGCVGCHFDGTQNYVVGGHSFNMRGTVDTEEILNKSVCETCHGEMDDFDYDDVQTDTEALLDDLRQLLVGAGYLDGTDHPMGDATPTMDEAGAVWNFLLVHEDRSHGVHNPDYIEDLLESSIDAMGGGSKRLARLGD